MRRITRIVVAAAALAIVGAGLAACSSDSDVASQNISTDAEQFKIERDIVFYNSITDKYVAEVKGKCSVDSAGAGLPGGTLAVTCKIGKNKYIKDLLGKADNVVWFELQEKAVPEDVFHYHVVFKPEEVIPNLDVETSAGK